MWRTRSGAEQVVIDEPSDYRGLAVAPDGRRAVVSQIGDQASGGNLWIVDLARSVRRRFTFGTADRAGVWLPDGLGVIFTAAKEGRIDLYRKSTDGTGTESEVLSDERPKSSLGVSRDGRILLFETGDDIWSMPLDGAAKAAPFVATAFEERYAQFSPDGRWVAYTSNESGRMEIYVRAFPGGDGLVQVSPNGGDLPRWSADGKELFFFNDGKIVAASVANLWRPVRCHVGDAAVRLPAARRVPPHVLRRRVRRPVPDDHPRFGAGTHAADLARQLARADDSAALIAPADKSTQSMNPRRIAEHVKTHNWFAVAIDFVIVVVGVFIGVQVSNWNDAASERRRTALIVEALRQDLRDSFVVEERFLAEVGAGLAAFDSALMRGEKPTPYFFRITGSDTPPSLMWQAATQSRLADLIHPDLLFDLGFYYSEREGIGAEYHALCGLRRG